MSRTRFQRVAAIFEEALERDAAERGAFVAEACGGDEDLRAEVEAMLSRHRPEEPGWLEVARRSLLEDAWGFENLCAEHPALADELRRLHDQIQRVQSVLRSRPALLAEVADVERLDQSSDDSTAGLLDRLAGLTPPRSRYRLLGEYARGGMGAILDVWDEPLQRELAMKVVLGRDGRRSPCHVDDSVLARFVEEALVTGQLDHPGIVPVHELGVDQDGQVYFTMRLVKGRDLREVFALAREERDGWTRTRALGTVLRACEALAYAHSKGVIHRDLKPSNIMVGRFGEVYVMDWGLAKVQGRKDKRDLRLRPADSGDDGNVAVDGVREGDRTVVVHGAREGSPLLTMDGSVLGTPSYMSPEQAAGETDRIDARSDVYAMGAILYELLAGRAPYAGPGERRSPREVLAAVRAGPPTPLHELATVEPELEAICGRAMARRPRDRYLDVVELADDLRAFLEQRVVSAYRTGPIAELRKWVARNKPLAASLAGVLLLLVVSSGVFAWLKAQADQRNEEVLRLARLQDLQALVDETDDLWPAEPERMEEMRSWIARTEKLVAELPAHRATLGKLQSLAPPQGSEEDGQVRWWRNQLTELIEGLESLQDPETGLLSPEGVLPGHGWSVPRRLAFARELEVGFAEGGQHDKVWAEALPAIRKAYPDVHLAPQVGLLPIGPDPESGLWEFAHLMTGVPAERGADGQLDLREETGVVLVLLPGGTYWMGAQRNDPDGQNYDPQAEFDEGPVHEVTLSPFFLSKYEMTQGQWMRMTGRNPSYYQPPNKAAPTLRHPVEQVSWEEFMQWLPRVRLRLPSEAEWEYGARGGTETPWWTGATRDSLEEHHAANLEDISRARAGYPGASERAWPEFDDGFVDHAPVGTYSANGYGLHEVPGNLWELCLDGYDHGYYARSPRTDPVSPWTGKRSRVDRGGGYNFGPELTRSASRTNTLPGFAHYNLGVRPARVIEP